MKRALLLMACLLASPAFAAAPTEIAPVIKAAKPYGEGKFVFLLNTAYEAELWTDAAQWSMDAPFALTIRYHMDFSTEDFVSRAKSEMKHVDPQLTDAALDGYGASMSKAFPAVKDGDEITALYQPGQPVQIFKNGTATGTMADAGFAKPFFGIWLSPETSEKGLRKKLLHL